VKKKMAAHQIMTATASKGTKTRGCGVSGDAKKHRGDENQRRLSCALKSVAQKRGNRRAAAAAASYRAASNSASAAHKRRGAQQARGAAKTATYCVSSGVAAKRRLRRLFMAWPSTPASRRVS